MSNVIVGALAMAAVWLASSHSRNQGIQLGIGKWILTVLVIFYWVFVILMGLGFLDEGAGQAALVMCLITGVPGVVFVVLLKRFVLVSR